MGKMATLRVSRSGKGYHKGMLEITRLIRQIVRPLIKPAHIKAKVISVNKDDSTCEVESLIDGGRMVGVRLRSSVNDQKAGLILYPKIDTTVTVGVVQGNMADVFVSQVEEFESCLIALQTGFKLEVNSDGEVLIESDKIDLGNGQGEPLVLGNTLNQRLNEIVQLISTLNNNLIAFATTQSTAAAANPATAGLAAGFTTLLNSRTSQASNIASIPSQLSEHLSQKVKTS